MEALSTLITSRLSKASQEKLVKNTKLRKAMTQLNMKMTLAQSICLARDKAGPRRKLEGLPSRRRG